MQGSMDSCQLTTLARISRDLAELADTAPDVPDLSKMLRLSKLLLGQQREPAAFQCAMRHALRLRGAQAFQELACAELGDPLVDVAHVLGVVHLEVVDELLAHDLRVVLKRNVIS